MKYLKKVSASQLISSEGTIIDSMNPGDDQTVNAPSIHAVKEYFSVDTGTLTSTSANATLNNCSYFKYGRIVQITGSITITNGTSSTWKTYDLVTLPEKLYPLQSTVISAIRDEDSKIIGVGIATARNALYIADRGRGSLTTNANAIPFNLVYVSST